MLDQPPGTPNPPPEEFVTGPRSPDPTTVPSSSYVVTSPLVTSTAAEPSDQLTRAWPAPSSRTTASPWAVPRSASTGTSTLRSGATAFPEASAAYTSAWTISLPSCSSSFPDSPCAHATKYSRPPTLTAVTEPGAVAAGS